MSVVNKTNNSMKMCCGQELKEGNKSISQIMEASIKRLLISPAITVDLLSCTKTERKMTTKKPLRVIVSPGRKIRERIVIEKTVAAYTLACLLESWGKETLK
jgi:hypothetical protein